MVCSQEHKVALIFLFEMKIIVKLKEGIMKGFLTTQLLKHTFGNWLTSLEPQEASGRPSMTEEQQLCELIVNPSHSKISTYEKLRNSHFPRNSQL